MGSLDFRTLTDENGKEVVYVPGSPFFQMLIREQLFFAATKGKEYFDNIQHDMYMYLARNDIFQGLEKSFRDEVNLVMRLSYAQVLEIVQSKSRQLEFNLPVEDEEEPKPQLKLVK